MAAMHAVEIADGNDRAAQRIIAGAFASANDERVSRMRLIVHGGFCGETGRSCS
jgi:hypothetical protein